MHIYTHFNLSRCECVLSACRCGQQILFSTFLRYIPIRTSCSSVFYCLGDLLSLVEFVVEVLLLLTQRAVYQLHIVK